MLLDTKNKIKISLIFMAVFLFIGFIVLPNFDLGLIQTNFVAVSFKKQQNKSFQQYKWTESFTDSGPDKTSKEGQLKNNLPEMPKTEGPDLTPREYLQLSPKYTKIDNKDVRQHYSVIFDNKNIGNEPTGSFELEVTLTCTRGKTTKDISFTKNFDSILPNNMAGNYMIVDESWCPFEHLQKVTLMQDPKNKIEELDEKNNTYTYTLSRDLDVEDIKQVEFLQQKEDPQRHFAFRVLAYPRQLNTSKDEAGKVMVRLKLEFNDESGLPQDYFFYDKTAIYLAPGVTYGKNFYIPDNITSYDRLNKISITVDPFNEIAETDENNNTFIYDVQHDYAIEQNSLKVTDGNGGNSMTVWYAKQRLIKDPVINNDVYTDVILTFRNGNKNVEKIYRDIGAVGAFDIKSEWGKKADLIAVKVMIDPDNLISETNENNNEAVLVLQQKYYNQNGNNNFEQFAP